MQITKSNREFAYFICSSMVLLTAILFSFSQLLVVSCIISSVNIIRKVRKSQILLLLSLFFFLYLFPSFLFFYFETQISVYEPFNNAHTFHVVTMIHSVFLYVFSNTVNEKHIRIDDDNLRMNVYKADIPYIICVLGILTTIILGKSGDTIFSGGGYGEGSTRGNALFEYCYVFYLLAYVFSGNSKGKTNLLVVLAVIYIVKSFLYGARIEIIAMTILVFICFFAHSFKTRTILLLAGCAYIGMSMFGVFRGNLNLSLRQAGQSKGGLMKAIVRLEDRLFSRKFAGLYEMSDEEAKKKKFAGSATLYYFKEMGRKTAVDYLRETDKPVLIMQGGMDFQVLAAEDFAAFQDQLTGRSNVEYRLYEDLNHLFVKGIYNDILKAGKEYKVEQHIGAEVLDDIAAFIESHAGGKS